MPFDRFCTEIDIPSVPEKHLQKLFYRNRVCNSLISHFPHWSFALCNIAKNNRYDSVHIG